MNITLHLKRHGWLYGLLTVLVVLPYVVLDMQKALPRDQETIRMVMDWHMQTLHENYGPTLPESYNELHASIDWSFENAPDIEGTSNNFLQEVRWQPEADPYIDAWLGRYGETLYALAELDTQGVTNDIDADGQYAGLPKISVHQQKVKMHRVLAQRAAASGQWGKALDELEYAAHSADPVRAHYLIGNLIAVACRSIAYAGYQELLGFDLPESALERALEDLQSLETTDPEINEMVSLSEHFNYALYMMKDDPQLRLFFLVDATAAAVGKQSLLETPGLKRYAQRHRGLNPKSYNPMKVFQHFGLRWTTLPAMKRFLRGVAENEPGFFEASNLPSEIIDSGDRLTLVTYFCRSSQDINSQVPEIVVRNRIVRTSGELTREAYAIRLQFLRTGEWPATVPALGRYDIHPYQFSGKPFRPLQSGLFDGDIPQVVRNQWAHQFRKLHTPPAFPGAHLFAIWSPGPDGDNDNALIPFDATNGTVSDGDILVFPR